MQFQLPKFAVVVWVRKTANYQATHDEISSSLVDSASSFQRLSRRPASSPRCAFSNSSRPISAIRTTAGLCSTSMRARKSAPGNGIIHTEVSRKEVAWSEWPTHGHVFDHVRPHWALALP